MKRFVCIHGHFYQPPRENPWLEAVETEDSAYPYHDWNERITAECYAPNAAARILDGEGRIARMIDNYERLSFNFGPTLCAWLERRAPEVYRAVIEADRRSRQRYGGHGSALAQPYNHMILPLADARDRRTQVLWGIRDFEHRFGRAPEGMWLPETAVDTASLEQFAELGIRFTVLAPHQAARVRAAEGGTWRPVEGRVDPRVAYRCRLPSGRSIDLVFYDGALSRGVAFEHLLDRGERFADRLLRGFDDGGGGGAARSAQPVQLVHLAADGETYGHHHRHGEMALAWVLRHLEERGGEHGVELTNYARFLAEHPPRYEVEIAEQTSWSCAHGVERWRSDCGCSTGGRPGWNQAWRRPLRDALDALRDEVAPLYERAAAELLADPWTARDDYVTVVLDRSPESVAAFLDRHAARGLDPGERVRALQLLELQRHAMLMYTSCGWFFADLGGIETVQVLRYAGRALQLAEELFDRPLEAAFVERLREAKSNLDEVGDGAALYARAVLPARVDLPKVAAHYAISSLFEDYPERARVHCYEIERRALETRRTGRARLALGRATVTSEVTGETAPVTFAVVHLGDQNLKAGVRPAASARGSLGPRGHLEPGGDADGGGDEAYRELVAEATGIFALGDFPGLLALFDRRFGEGTYSLRSLFRDEQRRILDQILASTLDDLEREYRQIFDRHAPWMRFLEGLGQPLPAGFRAAAGLVLNLDLKRAVEGDRLDPAEVERELHEATSWGLDLDPGLGLALARAIHRLVERLDEDPGDGGLLAALDHALALARRVPFPVELWEAQTAFYRFLEATWAGRAEAAAAGDEAAARWLAAVAEVGEKLRVRVG